MEDVITLIEGDAFNEIPKLTGTFDFVFVDAGKRDYRPFFDLIFPKLAKGGLYTAHNTYSMADQMADFLETIHNHPELVSEVVRAGSTGMSIPYRKK